jgi:hypothetical protein
MRISVEVYERPYDPEDIDYNQEPTDEHACALARALTHWFSYYTSDGSIQGGKYITNEPDRSAESIVLDILECNDLSIAPMTRDECEAIAKVFGLEI